MRLYDLFICFRWDDAKDTAEELKNFLVQTGDFARTRIFLAQDETPSTEGEFAKAASRSHVVVVLISQDWEDEIARKARYRELDIVRQEIEAARKANATIVPCFVNGRREPLNFDREGFPRKIRSALEGLIHQNLGDVTGNGEPPLGFGDLSARLRREQETSIASDARRTAQRGSFVSGLRGVAAATLAFFALAGWTGWAELEHAYSSSQVHDLRTEGRLNSDGEFKIFGTPGFFGDGSQPACDKTHNVPGVCELSEDAHGTPIRVTASGFYNLSLFAKADTAAPVCVGCRMYVERNGVTEPSFAKTDEWSSEWHDQVLGANIDQKDPYCTRSGSQVRPPLLGSEALDPFYGGASKYCSIQGETFLEEGDLIRTSIEYRGTSADIFARLTLVRMDVEQSSGTTKWLLGLFR